jgi:hypothetical protein
MNKNIINFLFQKSFLFLLLFLASNQISNAQQLSKIFEVPGGGSGSTNTSVESNDNSMLYIIGGAVIVGVIVYAVLKNKKDKEKSKDDTTAVLINKDLLDSNLSLTDKFINKNEYIPINISIGLQNDLVLKDQKRYFVGLAYNF